MVPWGDMGSLHSSNRSSALEFLWGRNRNALVLRDSEDYQSPGLSPSRGRIFRLCAFPFDFVAVLRDRGPSVVFTYSDCLGRTSETH